MKVLITGSSGFLGKHLVDTFLDAGHSVVGMDLKSSGISRSSFSEHLCDITEESKVTEIMGNVKPEVVIHSAAALAQFVPDENRMHAINVDGTKYLLAASENLGVSHFVFLSSVEVYGIDVPIPCTESAPINPICQYGYDKVECEEMCSQAHQSGMKTTIFRPPTIAGPGQNEPSLLDQVRCAHQGKSILLPGGGKTRLQMVNVFDVCSAILLALTKPAANGAILNLGSDIVPPLREVILGLYERAGNPPKIKGLSPRIARFLVKILHKLHISPVEPQHLEIVLRDYMFANSRAKEILGWKPLKDDIQSALDTYDWYVNEVLPRGGK